MAEDTVSVVSTEPSTVENKSPTVSSETMTAEDDALVVASEPTTGVGQKRKAGTEVSTISTVSTHKKPRLGPYPPFIPGIFDAEAITITVGAGKSRQDFTVHKRLLCTRSAFFEKALNGNFVEGKTNYITFPEDDPTVFEICLQFFYTSRLRVNSDKKRKSISTHLDVFILADKLLLPELQQQCWSCIRRHFCIGRLPSAQFIKKVCSVDVAAPKLREYLVQACGFIITFTKTGQSQWDDVLNANEGFSVDIAKDIARRRRRYQKEAKDHPLFLYRYLVFSSDNNIASAEDLRSFGRLLRMASNILFPTPTNSEYDHTFRDWPHKTPSGEQMMTASFARDHSSRNPDTAVCLHCKLVGVNWGESRDPLKYHREKSPDCIFLRALEDGEQPPLAKHLGLLAGMEDTGRRNKKGYLPSQT